MKIVPQNSHTRTASRNLSEVQAAFYEQQMKGETLPTDREWPYQSKTVSHILQIWHQILISIHSFNSQKNK